MSPTSASILLSSGGAIAQALGSAFEPRPEQVDLARAVERAMQARSHLFAEAGTGVGKSFAYLVPAMLRCALHGEVVVVATHTIALQEQLIQKDIPLVAEALAQAGVVPKPGADAPPAIRPVLVKGRGNYLSIRRLKLASERQDRLLPDAATRRSLHVIEDWAYDTSDGTLSTLPELERPAAWEYAQSDAGNCLGRSCPTYERCFYQRARREMEAGNLLVCNHALFFSDLALRARGVGFLPEHQHVVLDEAHGVEDAAAEHFGCALSESRPRRLLSVLHQPRTGRGFLSHAALVTQDATTVETAMRAASAAADAATEFFGSLLELDSISGGRDSARVRAAGVIPNPLTPAFHELTLALVALKDETRTDADRAELNAYAERARAIAIDARALIEQEMPGCAYWVESSTNPGGGRRVTLAAAPVDVSPILAQHLFGTERSVVLTSATLATSNDDDAPFAHALGRLGCARADTLLLGSPFDFASQMRVFVERRLPRPDAPDHAAILADRVLAHLRDTDGGAFVLFTSFRAIDDCARRIREPLDRLGLPLLVQGKDGPRGLLLERFRADRRSVLLGAASFWQGVDVRGEGLRSVIITRLPFEPPDRPLTQARLEAIEERGGDPFRDESLPKAILRFKQGVGRLIRSAGDRGRVVILDPRIVTTGYGMRFLSALPPGVRVEPEAGRTA